MILFIPFLSLILSDFQRLDHEGDSWQISGTEYLFGVALWVSHLALYLLLRSLCLVESWGRYPPFLALIRLALTKVFSWWPPEIWNFSYMSSRSLSFWAWNYECTCWPRLVFPSWPCDLLHQWLQFEIRRLSEKKYEPEIYYFGRKIYTGHHCQ